MVALAFTLFPRLAPDPGINYRAAVNVFAVERDVTLDEYLHRAALSSTRYRELRHDYVGGSGMSAADQQGLLELDGEVAYVRSTLEGFKHRHVTLRWSLYDWRSQRRVYLAGFGDVLAVRLHADAPTDRTMQLVWVPPPPGRGPYFVRVALYDARGTMLDVADSARFLGE